MPRNYEDTLLVEIFLSVYKSNHREKLKSCVLSYHKMVKYLCNFQVIDK